MAGFPQDLLPLRKQYEDSITKLLGQLQAVSPTGSTAAYKKKILFGIQQEMEVLDKFAVEWSNMKIPQAYRFGLMSSYLEYRKKGIDPGKVAFNAGVVQTLVDNASKSLVDANKFVGRTINDTLRKVSLEVIASKVATGDTVKETKKRLLDAFATNGIATLKDKNGKNVNLQSYAEMIARTTTREATNLGAIQEVEDAGDDLVQMTQHHSTCPICAVYEGRVYSISGKDTRYLPLSTVFKGHMTIHPNCTHSIVPYVRKFDDDPEQTELDSNRPMKVEPEQKASIDAYNRIQAKQATKRQIIDEWKASQAINPTKTPKSVSHFASMKNAKTKVYQELHEAVLEAKLPPGILTKTDAYDELQDHIDIQTKFFADMTAQEVYDAMSDELLLSAHYYKIDLGKILTQVQPNGKQLLGGINLKPVGQMNVKIPTPLTPKQMVEAMPTLDHSGKVVTNGFYVASPFPMADSTLTANMIDAAGQIGDLGIDWKDIPITVIDTNDAITIQKTITKTKLLGYLETYDKSGYGPPEPPKIIRVNGKNVIYGGNNEATFYQMSGQTMMPVKLIDVDAMGIQTKAKPKLKPYPAPNEAFESQLTWKETYDDLNDFIETSIKPKPGMLTPTGADIYSSLDTNFLKECKFHDIDVKLALQSHGIDPKFKLKSITLNAKAAPVKKAPIAPPSVVVPQATPASKINLTGLTYDRDGAYLGGAGQKSIFKNAAGEEFIFKPALDKSGKTASFKAALQQGVSELQLLLHPPSSIPVITYTHNGVKGTLQPLLGVRKIPTARLARYQAGEILLNHDEIVQLQREHVLDWLVGNFDSHGKNFIIDDDFDLLHGIDKEQAFRYLSDPMSRKMSRTYHPNKQYGESEPIYNQMFRDLADRRLDFDPMETLQYIQKVEALDDDKFLGMFKDYIEEYYGDQPTINAVNNLILARKKSLREDYEEFFSELLTQKNGTPTKFEFPKSTIHKSSTGWESRQRSTSPSDYKNLWDVHSGKRSTDGQKVYDYHRITLQSQYSTKEREAIKRYTGHSYSEINSFLRSGGTHAASPNQEAALTLRSAFLGKSPLPIDSIMYRHDRLGTLQQVLPSEDYKIASKILDHSTSAADRSLLIDRLKSTVLGSTYSDKAVMSAAYSPGIFVKANGVEFKILAPKGYDRGAIVQTISQNPSENEYIFAPDSKFRIVDISVERVQVGAAGVVGDETNLVFTMVPIE